MAIENFRNKETRALFEEGRSTKKWQSFAKVARKKLLMLNAATSLRDLKSPPNNQLEALRGDRAGQHSIRVNDQYRVCFRWKDGHSCDVEITDYH